MWPSDMALEIEEDDFELMPLLYSRAVWTVDDGEKLPEVERAPARRVASVERRVALEGEWRSAWTGRLRRIAEEDGIRLEALPVERALSAALSLHPDGYWSDRFDRLDAERCDAWRESVTKVPSIDASGELIAAWRAGFDRATILPFASPFARRLGRRRLLVDRSTWHDPATLRRVLERWPDLP